MCDGRCSPARKKMGTARLALLVAVVPLAVRAPNTYHRTEAVWGTLKRCDLLGAKNTGAMRDPTFARREASATTFAGRGCRTCGQR